MPTLQLAKPLGFRLAAAIEFYAAFTPGSGLAALPMEGSEGDELTLAFLLDGTFAPVVVALREQAACITAEYAGDAAPPVLRAQLARMLGLEVEGEAWTALGERDPVIGELQRSFPGFFTATKASPYDAATWAVIAPRMPMHRAAAIKLAIVRAHGEALTLRGRTHFVFPSPERLAELDRCEGLSEEKVLRLRGVAVAAQRGLLDPDRLRLLGEARALAELQTLRGIGPWAASHIYYRGVAPANALPFGEPRVLHGVAYAYGVETPTDQAYAALAEAWQPLRMWVTVLLMRNLGRSDRWRAPELARERTMAGKQLARRRVTG